MRKRLLICLIISILLATIIIPAYAATNPADIDNNDYAGSLEAPTGLHTTSIRSGILLKWNAAANTTYKIQRANSKNGTYAIIGKTSGNIYIDNTAKIDEHYYYRICSINGDKISAPTPAVAGRKLDPEKPMVAVTYDDGPNPKTTPVVLDAAEKHNAHVTFFVLGNRLSKGAALLQRAVNLGCEIGSHGWNHTSFAKLSAEGLKKQQNNTSAQIEAAINFYPVMSRPPYGELNKRARNNASFPYIMWSVDTLDWRHRDASKTVASVLTAEDGDIILMHDIHKPTAEAAEQVFAELENKGFQTATVSELAYYRNIYMKCGKKYFSMPK